MGISSKDIREVEFRERMRGYHQEDVDEFLEQVARGIEVLEEQLREAQAKAQRVGSQTQPQPAPRPIAEPPDDTIQRTLLLAQRTADQVIADANDQAGAFLRDARDEAAKIIEDARTRANSLVEEKARMVASEVDALEARRTDLLRELAEIAETTGSLRESLKASLGRLMNEIDASLIFDYTPSTPSTPLTSAEVSAPEAVKTPGDGGSPSVPTSDQFEDYSGEFDRTMIFPSSEPELPQDSADFTFGKPSFQVLEGDGPSAPVLFDDEDSRS